MAANKSASTSSDPQSIEELQKRFGELHKKQIEANTNLKNAQNQLEALRSEAQEKYGTSDLAALRTKLEEMKRDNENKRRDYQAQLAKIENDLAEVEEKFAAAEGTTTAEKSK